jgi:putative two-component system response regulator
MSPDIAKHGIRTAWLAQRLCEQLHLPDAVAATVAAAALTHDVGKELLPPELLAKPQSLTRAEHGMVQHHCAMGAWMLRQQALHGEQVSSDAVIVALLHHEWWNGHGYPFRLAGREIPLAARIVAVADVFDALCSERTYKAAWPAGLAREYIRHRSGVQFDPMCVDALLGIRPVELAAQYSNAVGRMRATPGPLPAVGAPVPA